MHGVGVRMHHRLRTRLGRMLATLAFAAGIAAVALAVGTRDLESYEEAFLSLNRGTEMQTIDVMGQPTYTLGVGLGVRLPLHGGLGASPAAALAPYLPVPATYWLLLALAVAAAVELARRALEPIAGHLVSWLGILLLFWSVPVVNYTIAADWPQTAVTYCTFVGCVFAPHALLHLLHAGAPRAAKGLAVLGVAGSVGGLVALSHAGYWPLLACALVLTAALALCRLDQPLRARIWAVAAVGVATSIVALSQLPDLFREVAVAAAPMRRYVDGTRGNLLLANAFPFTEINARAPFVFLPLLVVSLVAGVTWATACRRVLIVGSAGLALVLGLAAATLSPGESMFAPSTTWGFRDPAIAFAVLAGASAADVIRRLRLPTRGARAALVLLAIAALQGPILAATVAVTVVRQDGNRWRWNQDATDIGTRLTSRGFVAGHPQKGRRLALWPEVRQEIRDRRRSSTDLVDAGSLVVTASTKQRTMRGIIGPNETLFHQQIELPSRILCDAAIVHFLQLRYLLLPDDVECGPWRRLPDVRVDDWLNVATVPDPDVRVRALDRGRLSPQLRGEPAFSETSVLPSALVPLENTSLELGPRRITLRLPESSVDRDQVLVVPVTHDAAWQSSSGRVENVAGLVAVVDATSPRIALEFVPDTVAVLRALSAAAGQLLAVAGFIALAISR